jgi:hypothetical protein
MAPNIETIDRLIRVVAGVALILLAALGNVGAWGYIGIVPLATGLFRFCPAYRLIGLTEGRGVVMPIRSIRGGHHFWNY